MKKNGFTLVEMLAIVVLLAIIALVSTPLIMNVIANSKKSAFTSSMNGIRDAIETDYGERADFLNDSIVIEYEYNQGNLYYKKNGVKGEDGVPISGGISDGYGVGTIDEDGNVILTIYNTKYCGKINESGTTVSDCDSLAACKTACGL